MRARADRTFHGTDGTGSFTENLVIAACQQDDGDEQLCGASFGYDLYDQIVPCPGQRMRRDLQRDARQRHVAVALIQIDGQCLSGLHLSSLGRVQRQREPLLAALQILEGDRYFLTVPSEI